MKRKTQKSQGRQLRDKIERRFGDVIDRRRDASLLLSFIIKPTL